MFKSLFLAVGMLMFVAQSCFASISSEDETTILAGITASDATYYVLGGGLLVVMAGIWGFKRVKSLLGT
jgi:hypothetical protein